MAAGLLRFSARACGSAAALLAIGAGSLAIPLGTAALATPDPVAAACRQAIRAVDKERLRTLQDQLVAGVSPGSSLAKVLGAAEALIECEASVAALEVLGRHSPAAGPDRRAWLLLQWRAADAGLDHRRAAQALRWLAEGDPTNLETLDLPLAAPPGGAAVTRSALDVLADHLESLGRPAEAAEVLLASAIPGEATARRWARAVALAPPLDPDSRNRVLERALEQAADSGAWGLVVEVLDRQIAAEPEVGLASSLALQRRLRLSTRIDDAYGEWLLRRKLGSDPDRARDLESQLRSPRDPGGHAAGSSPITPP
jgi:hypothetical protein